MVILDPANWAMAGFDRRIGSMVGLSLSNVTRWMLLTMCDVSWAHFDFGWSSSRDSLDEAAFTFATDGDPCIAHWLDRVDHTLSYHVGNIEARRPRATLVPVWPLFLNLPLAKVLHYHGIRRWRPSFWPAPMREDSTLFGGTGYDACLVHLWLCLQKNTS